MLKVAAPTWNVVRQASAKPLSLSLATVSVRSVMDPAIHWLMSCSMAFRSSQSFTQYPSLSVFVWIFSETWKKRKDELFDRKQSRMHLNQVQRKGVPPLFFSRLCLSLTRDGGLFREVEEKWGIISLTDVGVRRGSDGKEDNLSRHVCCSVSFVTVEEINKS